MQLFLFQLKTNETFLPSSFLSNFLFYIMYVLYSVLRNCNCSIRLFVCFLSRSLNKDKDNKTKKLTSVSSFSLTTIHILSVTNIKEGHSILILLVTKGQQGKSLYS